MTIDSALHAGPGELSCLYSTESGQVGGKKR